MTAVVVVVVCATNWLDGWGSYKIYVEVLLASSFLEASVSSARAVMSVGEYRVESGSNVFDIVQPLLWKVQKLI